MTDLSTKIGQLVRNKRTEKKISQESLALLCGIDRSYLGRIERGEVNLTVEKLYEIASALEVDMKELLPWFLTPSPVASLLIQMAFFLDFYHNTLK